MTDKSPAPLWLKLAPAIFLLLWAAGYSFAKLGLRHAEPMTFLAWRYGCVIALFLPLALALHPAWPKRAKEWGHVAIVGFLIQAVYFGLCYLAFSLGVPAGTVALIVSLQPILVALLAPSLVGELVSRRRWLGLALGLAGAALVIYARGAIGVVSIAGIVACFGALLGMTLGTLYEKRFGLAHHPVPTNLIQYLIGFAAVLPLALIFEQGRIAWNGESVAALAYLVVGNSIIAITLLLAMIRRGEAARVSALFYLVPPMAGLIAWVMLGEAMPPLAWAGLGLAAIGVFLASWRAKASPLA